MCRARIRREKKRRLGLTGDTRPCATTDGRKISVYTNSEIASEVPDELRLGGEGVGLFRSEYVYMQEKNSPASEEKQFRVYKRLARAVKDRPAVIRTLDLGNERHPYFSRLLGGDEGALGVRGIRMSLRHPEIYKTQIRAILRASAFGNLKIVFPMVSSVEEVVEGRQLIKSIQKELLREGTAINEEIEIGVMVEVPSAVILLESLSAYSDFFAVGTNDLIQYTLAAGRSEDRLAHLFTPLHPAVLRSLRRVAQVAAQEDLMALVCGEIASHPIYATLLVGMGFRHLSMNAYAIPEIKQRLRKISYHQSREMLIEVLSLLWIQKGQQHRLEVRRLEWIRLHGKQLALGSNQRRPHRFEMKIRGLLSSHENEEIIQRRRRRLLTCHRLLCLLSRSGALHRSRRLRRSLSRLLRLARLSGRLLCAHTKSPTGYSLSDPHEGCKCRLRIE